MLKTITIITTVLLLFGSTTLNAQVDLIFPKEGYVFSSPNIRLEWNSFPNANTYYLQVSSSADFSTLIVDEPSLSNLFYFVQNLPANQHYFWRCKTDNSSWSSIRKFTIVNWSGQPETELWLIADSAAIEVDNKVSTWHDLSGKGNDFIQSNDARRPTFISNNSNFNHLNTIHFNATSKHFFEGIDFSALTEGEIFSLMKIENVPPSTNAKGGIWSFGPSNIGDLYPSINNKFASSFGRSSRFVFEYAMIDLTSPHLLNQSSSNSLRQKINNITFLDTLVGNVSFSNNITLGLSGSSFYLDGDITEVLFLNTVNDSLRDLANKYFQCKYSPPINLGSNISVEYGFCNTTIHSEKRFKSYLWSDGSTADSLITDKSGKYWVRVEDNFGYISTDTIKITFPSSTPPLSHIFCPNNSLIWEAHLGNNYSYLWSDGSTDDSLIINTPGNYYVTITDTLGCTLSSDTLYLSEDPFSTHVALSGDTSLCSGNKINLQSGADEVVSYLWNTGDTTDQIEITNSGTYSVEVTNINGCIAKDTVQVTVIGDAPIVNFDIPDYSCNRASFNFNDLSTTTDGSTIIGWNWDFGDGGTAITENGNYAYQTPGVYTINLEVASSSGCYNNLTIPIEIKANPELTFSSTYDCQKEEVQFYGGTTSLPIITSWNWNFDDVISDTNNTANIQNPYHTFENSGSYEIMLIGTDVYGCIDTLIQTKTIQPTPDVSFSFNEVCEGNVVHYQNNTTIDSTGSLAIYQWDLGDGTSSGQKDPNKPYNVSGVYNIELSVISEGGCSDSQSKELKIHAIPQVDYNLKQACAEIETEFEDNSFVPNGSVAQVNWSVNGQAPFSGLSATQSFSYPGTYQLQQTVSSAFGCYNSATSTFEIKDKLQADFVFSPNAFIAGSPISFESTSIGAANYHWTFGDFASSTEKDTTIVFSDSLIGNSYDVTLTIENQYGCSDSISVEKTVLGRETDLEVSQLFTQEVDGFLTVGVQLKNNGTTPINMVDLILHKTSSTILKEQWTGDLQSGEKENYVLAFQLNNTLEHDDYSKSYICIEGKIMDPSEFIETDLSNNIICKALTEEESVLLTPYPNPVGDQVTLQIISPKEDKGTLFIYDLYGKLITEVFNDEVIEKGLNNFTISTLSWSSGKYIVIYRGEKNVARNSLVKP